MQINADSVPTPALKKPDTPVVSANKLPGTQFAIERFLAANGQIGVLKNSHRLTWTDLQIGAEQINSQQTLFPFQLKSNIKQPQQFTTHPSIAMYRSLGF